MAATFGSRRSSCPTASRRRWRASSPSAAVKIDRMIAPSASCWSLRACPRRSRRKCTVQRCHGAPRTCASAALSPGWASEMASWTPTRPRATRLRRNSRQNASVSAAPTSRPMISRRPVSWAACANDDALAGHTPAVAALLDLRVDEQIRVAALQRPLPKRLHLLVEQAGDPADLALGDPQPEALHKLIDPARRHAAHIGLLHHADERLLAALARLQKAREVAALADLRDLQLDLTRPRVPPPGPIAVAVRRPILGALAVLSADQLGHLRLHQLLRHQAHGLADHVTVLLAQHLPDALLDRHPLGTGHRWRLLSSTPWNEPTILSATVAGTTSATSFRPTRTYTTLRDVTSPSWSA